MATGKPIVASGVPELEEYSEDISYAKNAKEFSEAVDRILTTGTMQDTNRVALAQEHGWNSRARQLLRLLQKTIG